MKLENFIAKVCALAPTASDAAQLAALAALKENGAPKPAADRPAGPPRALTLRAAAQVSGFSVMTIRRAIAANALKSVRPTGHRPRVLERDLSEWMGGKS